MPTTVSSPTTQASYPGGIEPMSIALLRRRLSADEIDVAVGGFRNSPDQRSH